MIYFNSARASLFFYPATLSDPIAFLLFVHQENWKFFKLFELLCDYSYLPTSQNISVMKSLKYAYRLQLFEVSVDNYCILELRLRKVNILSIRHFWVSNLFFSYIWRERWLVKAWWLYWFSCLIYLTGTYLELLQIIHF